MVDKIKNFAYSTFVDVATNFVSQPKESVFTEKGILTIKEFIEAGDTLVQKCPTWEWAGCDDPKKLKKEFPADKQYLITRKMPC
jgi:ubiquitin-like-conjugating enzyme ATG3